MNPEEKYKTAIGKRVSLWAGIIGHVNVEIVKKGDTYFVQRWEKLKWKTIRNSDGLAAEAFRRAFILRHEALLDAKEAIKIALRIDQ